MLLEPESSGLLGVDMLVPEDFYERRHRVIFRVMRELLNGGIPCDIIGLSNRIEEHGDMERAGGRMYLNELLDRTTTTSSFEYYAEIVRRKRILRQLIEAGRRISEMGFDEVSDPAVLLDQATSLLLEPQTLFGGAEIDHVSTVGEEYFSILKSLGSREFGLATGYRKIDQDLYDIRGMLTVIAGAPHMGKTVFGLNIIKNQAMSGYSCGVISLEMKRTAVVERLIQMAGHLTRNELRYDVDKRTKAAMKALALPIWVSEVRPRTLPAVLRQMRVLVQRHKVDTILVDYLQLVEGPSSERQDIEIGKVTKAFLDFSQENNVAVITPCQVNRDAMQTKGEPKLWNMKDSARIEADSSVILGIWRASYVSDKAVPDSEPFYVRVLKNRSGITGNKTDLIFYPHEQRIEAAYHGGDS